jgi:hypothetical protein
VGIERLDEGDASVEDRGRRAADVPAPAAPLTLPYETRDRETYYAEYRAAVDAEYRAAARESWDGVAPQLREAWADHEKKWPSPERQEQSPQPDIPGAWRGDGGRYLDPEANAEVDRGCAKIREVGENVITPALRHIETQDPERELVGLNNHLKGPDRLKEKVADDVRYKGRAPDEALANLKDAIRFTYVYTEDRYTAGAQADCTRLREDGFQPYDRKNSWPDEEYKGINSRWREPESGQLFEVQFHTRASFEAKELTHIAYERLRNPMTSDHERDDLQSFQRLVSGKVSVPLGVTEIEDYAPEKRDG